MTTGKTSLSSHPAFAPIVGLWFAALLGGGLMVMPYAIHETLAARTGLDTLVPAGMATRAAIAGAGALVGLLLGLAIAGRAAHANAALAAEDEDWPVETEEAASVAATDEVWLDDAASEPSETGEPRRQLFNPREDLDEAGIAASGAGAPAHETESEDYGSASALIEEWRADQGYTQTVANPEADADPEPVVELVQDAEFEDVAEVEPAPEPEPETEMGEFPDNSSQAESPAPPEPLGDLPLAALTERLREALATSRNQQNDPPAVAEQDDQVIAFLRRESSRPATDAESQQAILRSALDKLTRVHKPQ